MYFCILLLFTYYYSKFANLIKAIYKKFLFELNKKEHILKKEKEIIYQILSVFLNLQ